LRLKGFKIGAGSMARLPNGSEHVFTHHACELCKSACPLQMRRHGRASSAARGENSVSSMTSSLESLDSSIASATFLLCKQNGPQPPGRSCRRRSCER
jgi:hypothetical protein